MSGAEMIAAERQRQIAEEGWTEGHDDQHGNFELTKAAECYARHAHGMHSMYWPWDRSWWKPSPDPVKNLIKAGALIAAEIDRLQRTRK